MPKPISKSEGKWSFWRSDGHKSIDFTRWSKKMMRRARRRYARKLCREERVNF